MPIPMLESGENYLETILLLKRQKGYVRSIDIAKTLDFAKPSVSRAVGILENDGYITRNVGGDIELTEEGLIKAEAIYERHCLLAEFLELTAGVDEEIAEKDACRIEHVISVETFEGIKDFVRNQKK